MQYIQLIHDKGMGYPSDRKMGPVPVDILEAYNKADYFITFYPIAGKKNKRTILGVNACTRFINQFKGNIIIYKLEEASEFATPIMWDIAHTLRVGDTVTCIGLANIYRTPYYKGCMEIIDGNGEITIFKKIKPLLVEEDAGLEDWSFGIPVGPGDATGLNAVVKRILEIPCHHKEIILCGKPGANFKYSNQVKIVGEDIPAPPVQICRKKNLLAKTARYSNLCILHDRVFLPLNFMEAMKKYGDHFGFLSFQQLFFGDKWNRCFIRYSDFNATRYLSTECGIIDQNKNILAQAHGFLSTLSGSNGDFFYSNVCRYDYQSYVTGSMYITKRKLWNFCPQNENLFWDELEDVEHGLRAHKMGIKESINPYAFAQSLFGRKMILNNGSNRMQTKHGEIIQTYHYFRYIHGTKKPAFTLTVDKFRSNLYKFCQKYHVNYNELPINNRIFDGDIRMQCILRCIMLASLPASWRKITQFVEDIDKLLFNGGISKIDKLYWSRVFSQRKALGKYDFINWKWIIDSYLLTKGKNIFCKSLKDFFVPHTILNKVGSLVTAWNLWRHNGELFYNPEGLKGFYRNILLSTPWEEYAEDN